MSETERRMSFERNAYSKSGKSSIFSSGLFDSGESLASSAAVAGSSLTK